jgi:hypothetical protein
MRGGQCVVIADCRIMRAVVDIVSYALYCRPALCGARGNDHATSFNLLDFQAIRRLLHISRDDAAVAIVTGMLFGPKRCKNKVSPLIKRTSRLTRTTLTMGCISISCW